MKDVGHRGHGTDLVLVLFVKYMMKGKGAKKMWVLTPKNLKSMGDNAPTTPMLSRPL